jgi:hypothetical protein
MSCRQYTGISQTLSERLQRGCRSVWWPQPPLSCVSYRGSCREQVIRSGYWCAVWLSTFSVKVYVPEDHGPQGCDHAVSATSHTAIPQMFTAIRTRMSYSTLKTSLKYLRFCKLHIVRSSPTKRAHLLVKVDYVCLESCKSQCKSL